MMKKVSSLQLLLFASVTDPRTAATWLDAEGASIIGTLRKVR